MEIGELTSERAAAYVGVTRQAISAAAKAGKIGVRQGRDYRFTHAELDRWKAERHAGGRPKGAAGTPCLVTFPA